MSSSADAPYPVIVPIDDPSSPIHHRWWGLSLKVLAALLVVVAGAWFWSSILEPHEAAMERTLQDLGFWGPVIFIAIFVLGTSLFFPESILSIAAGAIFGLGWGLVWSAVAGMISVAAVFLVGRRLFFDAAVGMLSRHPRIAALEAAAESQGLRLVFLLRLSPLNFTILNWILAASHVRFRTVMLGAIGMIPGNFSTVYIGYAARHTADLAARAQSGSPDGIVAGDSLFQEISLYAGLGASVLVTVLVTRIAVKALKTSTESEGQPDSTPSG